MRVVLFGSGSEYSRVILEALGERDMLTAVITPGARGPWPGRWIRALRIWRGGRPFRRQARKLGVQVIPFRSATDEAFVARLRALNADIFVIAAFPYVIPASVRDLARYGALNVHPSLLPRHRGADPLFWTFFCDDAVTGTTVHWVVDSVDAGDIVRQQSVPVRRGMSCEALTEELARLGAKLAVNAIEDLSAGRATRTPQNELLATTEPNPSAGGWSIDFASWSAERLWHFLRGVGVSHANAIRRVLPVDEAIDFTIGTPTRPPGTIEPGSGKVRVYTGDGWVTAHELR
jgi:methionyl-tRNA formyltransferase